MEGKLSVTENEETTRRKPAHCFSREQKNFTLAEVEEIRGILGALYGVHPQDIIVCDLCSAFALFGTDNAKPECYLVQHHGRAPPWGFCMGFVAGPSRDPRKGEVLLKLQEAHQNPKSEL